MTIKKATVTVNPVTWVTTNEGATMPTKFQAVGEYKGTRIFSDPMPSENMARKDLEHQLEKYANAIEAITARLAGSDDKQYSVNRYNQIDFV